MTKSEEFIERLSPEQQAAMLKFREAHYNLCREYILVGSPLTADLKADKYTFDELNRFSQELEARNTVVYSVCVEAVARIIMTKAGDATEDGIEEHGLLGAPCVHTYIFRLISNLSVQMFETVEKIYQERHPKPDTQEDGDDAPDNLH